MMRNGVIPPAAPAPALQAMFKGLFDGYRLSPFFHGLSSISSGHKPIIRVFADHVTFEVDRVPAPEVAEICSLEGQRDEFGLERRE